MQDLIPISALQHFLFCPRQCALIHIDGLWAENRLTVEGKILHQGVDQAGSRVRGDRTGRRSSVSSGCFSPPREGYRKRVDRAVALSSDRFGLIGKADTVEWLLGPVGEFAGPPRPVEHKRGRPKRIEADRVQLCAQALCLEEMLGVASGFPEEDGEIKEGELFYHVTRHREVVTFTPELRSQTIRTILAVRLLIQSGRTPRAERAPKCQSCSLLDLCLPGGTGPSRSPKLYLQRSLAASIGRNP